MNAVILSVGHELISGQTTDTNAVWLSQRLAELGVAATMHVTVGDALEPLTREIRRAAAQADVVLITGGLGPTADDLTRDAIAAAMDAPLERHEPSLKQIRDFFARLGRTMTPANEVQAMIPAGAEPIENTCGTAPGIRARLNKGLLFALPGVPREMREMFARHAAPALKSHTGGRAILTTTLYTYGAPEATLGEQIRDLMNRDRNPTVGTTAQQTIIGVRILAQGDSVEHARTLLERDADEIRRRLGSKVFGRDDPRIEMAVAELLKQHGKTIATAESCTGGLIAKRLTDIPGSSAYFLQGFVTYSNDAKTQMLGVPAELIALHGAVSVAVAEALAVNCRRQAGADFAISVTGIAGPDGGTADKPVGLVYVGLADRDGCEVKQYRLGNELSREEIRDRTAKAALNRLRLRLIGSAGW
ncbi:MAG: competence/damage-inducible protein A [Phycisphaerae bacterium]